MSVRHGLLALLAEGPSYGYQLRARLEARTGGTWPLNIGQVYTTLTRLERDGLIEAADGDDPEDREGARDDGSGASGPGSVASGGSGASGPGSVASGGSSGSGASEARTGGGSSGTGSSSSSGTGSSSSSSSGTGSGSSSQATYRITAAGRRSVAEWFASPVERASPARDELAIKLALAVSSPMAEVRQVVQVQRGATMRAMQELTRLKARADEDADLAWLLVLDALIFQTEAEVRWLDHCESRVARAAAQPRRPDPVDTGRREAGGTQVPETVDTGSPGAVGTEVPQAEGVRR